MHAEALKLPAEFKGIQRRLLGPALDGDLAVPYIHAHGDFFPVCLHCLPQKTGIGDSGGAEDDAVDAGLQIALYYRHAAHTAADLGKERRGGTDAFDGLKVRGFPCFCALEVDKVQAACALLIESLGNFGRVFAVDGHLRIVALIQAHGLAVV